MPGAADTRMMTETDLAAATDRQRLERMLAVFPAEIATAARLATEQAAAMAALAASTGQIA